MSEVVRDCQRLSDIVRDCKKLSETVRVGQRWIEIAWKGARCEIVLLPLLLRCNQIFFGEIVQMGEIVQIVQIVQKIPPLFGATYTK